MNGRNYVSSTATILIQFFSSISVETKQNEHQQIACFVHLNWLTDTTIGQKRNWTGYRGAPHPRFVGYTLLMQVEESIPTFHTVPTTSD